MMYLLSFVAGLVLGIVFAILKLPVPAPSNIAGVIGIMGVTIGYILIKHYTA